MPEKPKYGCYVSGLYLEGAGWDHVHSHLKRQDPKVLVTELPILQIVPIEANKLKLANTFRAPVYVTQVRRQQRWRPARAASRAAVCMHVRVCLCICACVYVQSDRLSVLACECASLCMLGGVVMAVR